MTKRETARLLAALYGTVLAVILLIDAFFLGCDAIGRSTGSIETRTLSVGDIGTSGLEPADEGGVYSVNEDPQFLLPVTGRTVIVRMELTYSMDPGEVMLFYAREGEDYSKEKCVYPRVLGEGVYEFLLPSFGVESLRLDPASRSGVVMTDVTITLNAPRSVWSYFAMSNGELFNYVVYTGMAAAAACWLWTNFGAQITARWRAPLEHALHLKKRGT